MSRPVCYRFGWKHGSDPAVDRRSFVTLIGGAVAWPIAAYAQKVMPVIGYLSPGTAQMYARSRGAFLNGLAEIGYIEGRNIAIEYLWAEGQYDRLSSLADELVRRQVAVIVTGGSTPAALAARAATETIPIVFVLGSDPVQFGLVKTLSRPGGNVTGVTNLDIELITKTFELLHDLVPAATTIGVLVNPNNSVYEAQTREARIAATNLKVHLLILNVTGQSDIETAFANIAERQPGALVVTGDSFFAGTAARDQIITLAAHHAVPTIYPFRVFAESGGLMAYGTNTTDAYRLAGVYAGRILNGENPADLPVQQPSKIELYINLKTAQALGLAVPQTLLARADEVIE
jgi:putative tryptophan/tyrosine transport system substrate-binding protein